MSETIPDLTIVVPAYNEEKYIGECLEAILKECTNTTLKVEVMVIDNNSTDDTARVVQGFPEVRLIHEPIKGITAARRCGLENASAPLLANVDADTHMPKDWINRVYAEFQKNPKVMLVSGPYTYYDVPWYTTALVWIWWNVFAYPAYLIIGHMAVGGNFALRTEVMKRIGGFDETIAFYGEDTNIARRLHAEGKVRFMRTLIMPSSGRRLNDDGIISSGYVYLLNFLSEVLFKKPFTEEYRDVR
jgi:glycosyltransferase involved in cell wall biosynthesis